MDDPARGPQPAPPPPPTGADWAPYGSAQPPLAAGEATGKPVTSRKGRRISIPGIVIGLTMVASILFIGYVVLRVEDNQIPLMATGFVVLGASLAAVALWCVIGIWRSASRARGGRAFALAIVGGLAGIGAIGCFTVAALSSLVLNT
jgi:hypothetical protein